MKNNPEFSTTLAEELQSVASPAEVKALHRVGLYLANAPQPQRSKQAHQALWYRLSTEAADVKKRGLKLAWKLALAPLLLIALVFALPFMSQSALPGDATYSIKRATENVQLAAALSPAKKANLCSIQMKQRANELAKLSEKNISTGTVQYLTSSIMEEANEFQEYTRKSGAQKAQLEQQRNRDVSYVIDALNKAAGSVDENQLKLINATKDDLQKGLSS